MDPTLLSGTVPLAGNHDASLVLVLPEDTVLAVAEEAVMAAATEGVDMLVRMEAFGASRSDPSALVAIAFVVQEIGIGVAASAVWSGIVATARSVLGRLSRTLKGDAGQSFRISITVIDAKGPVLVEAEATGVDAAERGLDGLRDAVLAALESRSGK